MILLTNCYQSFKDPDYSKATAVVITLLVDNYDIHSSDPEDQFHLRRAMSWEKAFVQGCNSIDIWNLRLELGRKLRQELRTRLGTRFLAVG